MGAGPEPVKAPPGMRPGRDKARASGASPPPRRREFLLRGLAHRLREGRWPAGTLTRRRRGEAACSPSADCPSPWPRQPVAAGCHGREAARRMRCVAGSAALRRPPAPPPCARPYCGTLRSAPSAAWPPAPHRPLRREPGSQREPRARQSRGGGRVVTPRGGVRPGRSAAGVWARFLVPIGRRANVGGAETAQSAGLFGGPAWPST